MRHSSQCGIVHNHLHAHAAETSCIPWSLYDIKQSFCSYADHCAVPVTQNIIRWEVRSISFCAALRTRCCTFVWSNYHLNPIPFQQQIARPSQEEKVEEKVEEEKSDKSEKKEEEKKDEEEKDEKEESK